MLREAGIPTPDWVALPHDRFSELGAVAVLDRIVDRLGLPLMVKPAQGGSGLGAAVVRDAAALPAAMVGCFAYDSTALVERYVRGMDVAVSIVDLGDGPAGAAGRRDRAPQRRVRLRRPLHGRPDHLARPGPARSGGGRAGSPRRRWPRTTALGLRDLSRVDLIVDVGGRAAVLEVNVSPGMTETSLLPLAVQAAGLDLGEVLAQLVERAANRKS